ncbi:MAG: elongation factor 1-alpha C-terminal domain-related protein, partial [Gammaproteobacteria bacterium]
ATVTAINAQINVNTLERGRADRLELNGIAECTLNIDRAIAFDPYADNRDTGGFILIDRLSNNTVGAGLIIRAAAAVAGTTDIDRAARETMKGQQAAIIRVAGGVEAARLQERQLHAEGRHTYVLDAATVKNAEEIAAILVDAGLIVLLANGR